MSAANLSARILSAANLSAALSSSVFLSERRYPPPKTHFGDRSNLRIRAHSPGYTSNRTPCSDNLPMRAENRTFSGQVILSTIFGCLFALFASAINALRSGADLIFAPPHIRQE